MRLLVNPFKATLLLLSFIISITACHNYKPGYINSPTFEEKGDLFVDVNIGSQSGGNLSYSPLNNWAVLMNAGEAGVGDVSSEDELYVNKNKRLVNSFNYPNYFYEFASGYYNRINDNFYLDLYLGYGKGESGSSSIRFDLFDSNQDLVAYKNDFENVFLQTNLKAFLIDELRLILSGRMNVLNFYNFDYVFEETTQSNYSMKPNDPLPPQGEIDAYFRNNKRIAYQLGFGIEADLKYFLINSQIQFGMEDYELDNPPNFYSVRPFSLFLGLSVPIHQFWKKEN